MQDRELRDVGVPVMTLAVDWWPDWRTVDKNLDIASILMIARMGANVARSLPLILMPLFSRSRSLDSTESCVFVMTMALPLLWESTMANED